MFAGLLKIQIHSLPAGGTFGAEETEVALLINATLSDKIKKPLKCF